MGTGTYLCTLYLPTCCEDSRSSPHRGSPGLIAEDEVGSDRRARASYAHQNRRSCLPLPTHLLPHHGYHVCSRLVAGTLVSMVSALQASERQPSTRNHLPSRCRIARAVSIPAFPQACDHPSSVGLHSPVVSRRSREYCHVGSTKVWRPPSRRRLRRFVRQR